MRSIWIFLSQWASSRPLSVRQACVDITRTFQSNSFVPAVFIDTIDLYHFIPVWEALSEGHRVSEKQNLLASFYRTFLNWSSVAWCWSYSSCTLWFCLKWHWCSQGNSCCFTDCVNKLGYSAGMYSDVYELIWFWIFVLIDLDSTDLYTLTLVLVTSTFIQGREAHFRDFVEKNVRLCWTFCCCIVLFLSSLVWYNIPSGHMVKSWYSKEATKNGGGGVFVKLSNGSSIRKSVATWQQSANCRTEACSLLVTAQNLTREEGLPAITVTTCPSRSLYTPGREQISGNIRQELSLLNNKTSVTLRWILSGVGGNWEVGRVYRGKEVGVVYTPHVLERSKGHSKKELQDILATTPGHWNRRGQHPPAGHNSLNHWHLDTVNLSPTSTDRK